MLDSFRYALYDTMRGRRRTPLALVFRWLVLFPLSLLYGFWFAWRRCAFRLGIYKSYKAPLHVISVGNIVAGGSGKTPVTLLLAGLLAKDRSVAVLSRGYKSAAEKGEAPIRIDPGDASHTAEVCGDEPLLIARRLPEVAVFSGRDRVRSSQQAAAEGRELVILDDGMQHWRLQRDREVVVVDARDPFCGEYLLPMGLLREAPTALKRADLIVLSNVAGDTTKTEACIRQHTAAPIVKTAPRIDSVQLLNGNPIHLAEKKVGLFCGIAHPERFEETVGAEGATVVDRWFLADHAAISCEGLQTFASRARGAGAEYLVCTEKDWVRLPEIKLGLPVAVLRLSLQLLDCEPEQLVRLVEPVAKNV